MNCSLNTVAGLIAAAIALLLAAIVVSYLWVAAVPLFLAAGFVATVSFGLIPAIKNALVAYAQCRGGTGKCSMSLGINTLGQAAATLSLISFLAAAVMEVAALAFLYSFFLAWLGVSIQVAVAFMVTSGQFSCAITILILLGVLSNAWSYKNCMDQQSSESGSTSGGILQ
jgi:hypothetical protein